jgi:dienelactone hydrolase
MGFFSIGASFSDALIEYITPNRRLLVAAVCAVAMVLPVHGQDVVEQSLRIPMPAAGKNGLEAVVVRPNDDAAHPLAVINHGSPREADQRLSMTAWSLIPQAREFARRGWTTVVVVRRGYGTSGGGYSEDARGCSSDPQYYAAGIESAKDIRAAIAYLSTLPMVDASRIISVGVSAGGFATVALTADPPPGLIAGISFAGGRGSQQPDEVCGAGDLIRAFAQFGKRSRTPMLWVYADNDHFFGPAIAAQFYEAFTSTGGVARFVRAPAFRRDGHGLFSLGGIALWTPMVDDFLASRQLKLREALLSLPAPPSIEPPSQLSAEGRDEFRSFLTLPAHRAFAVSTSGHYGYAFGRHGEDEAKKYALNHCRAAGQSTDHCIVVSSDD